MDIASLMESSVLVASLGEPELKAALEDGRIYSRKYGAGSLIHLATDTCTRLEIILDGMVAVERIGEDGKTRLIGRFGSGGILGGSLMFSRNPAYLMTVSALLDTSLLCADTEHLFRLLRERPAFLRAYLEMTAERTVLLGERIRKREGTGLRARIIEHLLAESKEQASMTIRLRMSKTELAKVLGVERSSLSRELSKMEDDRLLTVRGKEIRLNRNSLPSSGL